MSEMIERVARAIYDKSPIYTAKPNIGEPMHALTWDEAEKYGREDYFDQARAAIEAMREPTPGMLNHPSYIQGEWSRRNVESFIDAAINEGK